MSKFRVMIVKKNGQPVGVRAAAINGRTIVLALHDEPKQMSWYDAVKLGIPTKEEWMAIAENLDAVNKALVRAGGEPLEKSGIGLRRKAATVGRGPLALVAVTVWATAVKTTLATLARY